MKPKRAPFIFGNPNNQPKFRFSQKKPENKTVGVNNEYNPFGTTFYSHLRMEMKKNKGNK